METCPLCLKKANLQPEGLFPAWMQPPENPSLMLCESCIHRFTRTAAFTVEFFKDRKFLKKTTEPDYYDTFFGSEFHHKSARIALLYFLVGLSLKHHLLLTARNEKDLLGGSFERLAADYNGRFLEENDYQFWAALQPERQDLFAPPSRTRIEDLNAVEIGLFGYRFFLFTDQRTLPTDSLIRKLAQAEDFVVMVSSGSDDILADFKTFMEERA